MKNTFKFLVLFGLLFLAGISSCKKEEINTDITGVAIDNYDLVQITDANRNLPVSIEVSGNEGIDSVSVRVFKDGATTPVTMQTIKRFTDNQFGRINLPVSFPVAAVAPNGLYKVVYTVYDKKGQSVTKEYLVNVLNNQTTKYCNFENKPLPSGKNTWIRVISTLPLAPTDKVYFTGSFEEANGGTSNWTGGRDLFIMNRISPNCFEIAVNLNSSNEFKFTLGDWGKECFDNKGNPTSNFKWVGGNSQEYTIYNWKTKDIVIQDIALPLPAEGIASGKLSVIADVNSNDNNIKYYLVKKGGDITDKSNPMFRVTGTSKVMGAMPKDKTSEYIVVRDDGKKGVNLWGFPTFVPKWNGVSNPVNVTIPYFESSAAILTVPANLFIVGDAPPPPTWTNPVPVPLQQFTIKSPGIFELTINLTGKKSYIILPVNGSWDNKLGGTDKMGGTLLAGNQVPGSNTPSPDDDGTYTITVDFTTASYTLAKKP